MDNTKWDVFWDTVYITRLLYTVNHKNVPPKIHIFANKTDFENF